MNHLGENFDDLVLSEYYPSHFTFEEVPIIDLEDVHDLGDMRTVNAVYRPLYVSEELLPSF